MPDERLIVPCDCVGTCSYLVLEKFEWKNSADPDDWYAEFYSCGPWQSRLRHRAKAAWKLLRGKDHYLHCLYMEPASARKLRDWLADNV